MGLLVAAGREVSPPGEAVLRPTAITLAPLQPRPSPLPWPQPVQDSVLNALVGAAFGAAGQRCMALSVAVLVGSSKEWIPELVQKTKTLRVGPGMDPSTDVGPLISPVSCRDRG